MKRLGSSIAVLYKNDNIPYCHSYLNWGGGAIARTDGVMVYVIQKGTPKHKINSYKIFVLGAYAYDCVFIYMQIFTDIRYASFMVSRVEYR